MAIVKFHRDLLAANPDFKDFVCGFSTTPVLDVTTSQDAIDGVEAYLIESDEIPREGKLDILFISSIDGRTKPSADGYRRFPGLYRGQYAGYWKVSQ